MSEKVPAPRDTPAMVDYRAKLERVFPGITKLPKAENSQASCVLSTVPEFMDDDIGKGVEHIQDQDCVWYVGIENVNENITGELKMDPQWESGYEVPPLVETILLAIISANSNIHDAAGMLVTAKNVLRIEPVKRGRPKSIDDFYLREIARHCRKGMFDNKSSKFRLDAAIKKIIREHIRGGQDLQPQDDAVIERLRKKFRRQQVKLLSAIGTEDLAERGPRLAAARRILRDLKFLGVRINGDHLDPALFASKARQAD